MTIAAAIVLLVVGACLHYALSFHIYGLSLDTTGLILMVSGAVGLGLSLLQEAVWPKRADPDGPYRD